MRVLERDEAEHRDRRGRRTPFHFEPQVAGRFQRFEHRADSLSAAGRRYVPHEPIVPSRCESLPTVSRLPAVTAYSFARAIRLAMNAAVIQLDRVDGIHHGFTNG